MNEKIFRHDTGLLGKKQAVRNGSGGDTNPRHAVQAKAEIRSITQNMLIVPMA